VKLSYTISEAAAALGISKSALYEELAVGKLTAKKRNTTTLISAEVLRAYLDGLPDYEPLYPSKS
jgi:excisionase family DNA binding protein